MLDKIYYIFQLAALFLLSLMVLLSFFKAIREKKISDKIVAINMIGTQVIIMICLLCYMLKESYLADIAIIYAIISFLSVVVLCKVFLGSYYAGRERKSANSDYVNNHAENKNSKQNAESDSEYGENSGQGIEKHAKADSNQNAENDSKNKEQNNINIENAKNIENREKSEQKRAEAELREGND